MEHKTLRTLVVGIGDMGGAHARGYATIPGYSIVGFVVAKNIERAKKLSAELGIDVPIFTDFYEGMRQTKPDLPVVLMSGLWDSNIIQELRTSRRIWSLSKPFTSKDLESTIRKAIYS